MAIPTITPYNGGVANPDGSQTQAEFTQNMFDQLSYEAQLASELNATVNATNTTASEVDASASVAQNSSDAAQAAANFEGDFTVGVTSAVKGKSYFYSGDVWLCLQNTTTTPSTGNAAWKLSVGEQYVTKSQEQQLPPGSKIYPIDGSYLEIGDSVTSGTTHLRVLIGGEPTIVAMSPVASGVVSSLVGTGATIGGNAVNFALINHLIFPDVTALKSAPVNPSLLDLYDIKAKTTSYHGGWAALMKPIGGTEYVLTTRQRVRDALGDTLWEPDGYGDHYLFGGVDYVAVLNQQGRLFAEMFGLSENRLATDNKNSMQAAVNYIGDYGLGRLDIGAGDFLIDQVNIINRSIYLVGANRNETLFINEGSGNVFAFISDDGDAFKRSLRVKSIGFGRVITDGVHTSSGSHAVYSDGYNDVNFEDIQLNQSGGSGIKVRQSYVINWKNIRGGHAGQNVVLQDGTLGVLDFKRDGGTGNSVRLNNCYLSNSLNTDGLNIDYAQSVSIQDTTMESCQRLIKIGTVGFTTRNVSVGGNSYFENPAVCCGEFINVFGVDLLGAYTNLTGPQSPNVEAVFKFELVDRLKIRGGSLSAPPSGVGNTEYKGALEFKTFGSLSVPGMMDIEASTSINEICINSTAEGRQSYNILDNRAGLRIKSIDNLWRPHSNLLTNTDLTTWNNAGGLPVTTGEFYDGAPFYEIDGDGSNTINISVTTAVSSGNPLSFSAWAQGEVRLQIRGRRVSDNGFETVATLDSISSDTGANEGSDIARRIYANGKALSDYNLINVIIRPVDVASIGYVQLNESLTPTDYK